jgi:hypothetical protein
MASLPPDSPDHHRSSAGLGGVMPSALSRRFLRCRSTRVFFEKLLDISAQARKRERLGIPKQAYN